MCRNLRVPLSAGREKGARAENTAGRVCNISPVRLPDSVWIAVYFGIAVMFDAGNSQNLLPVFTNVLVVATLLLWGRAKKVR